MSNYISENIALSVTVVLTLFGIIAAHYLAQSRSRKADFTKSAHDFGSVIRTQLMAIYPSATNWPDNIGDFLSNKFSILQSAAAAFEVTLPWHKRIGFRRAWRMYSVGTDPTSQSKKQEYHQYMGFTINDHYINPQQRLKENVDRLLNYTKT